MFAVSSRRPFDTIVTLDSVMQPRPLHRWKSFWFGILSFVFLGWASWDSRNTARSVSDWGWALVRIDGTTRVIHQPDVLLFGGGFHRHPDPIHRTLTPVFLGCSERFLLLRARSGFRGSRFHPLAGLDSLASEEERAVRASQDTMRNSLLLPLTPVPRGRINDLA